MMGTETVRNEVDSGIPKITANTLMATISLLSEITSRIKCNASLLLFHTTR